MLNVTDLAELSDHDREAIELFADFLQHVGKGSVRRGALKDPATWKRLCDWINEDREHRLKWTGLEEGCVPLPDTRVTGGES
jgi:hypothetical protein